jgi:hypothetical protein
MAKKLVIRAGRGASHPTENWNSVSMKQRLLGDNENVSKSVEDRRMLSINKENVTRLQISMEVVGQFDELMEQDGVLLAEIANHIVILTVGMKEVLLPHIGSRIAILRTDLPGKEYLFRVFPDLEKTAIMRENARAPDNCEASA